MKGKNISRLSFRSMKLKLTERQTENQNEKTTSQFTGQNYPSGRKEKNLGKNNATNMKQFDFTILTLQSCGDFKLKPVSASV